MNKIYSTVIVLLCSLYTAVQAQQLPNASFEDWSAAAFDGNAQPASWNASNVTQFGFKFNFAHKEAGHTGSASMMVQDQEVGAAGITEVSPGYFSLGQPWVYIKSLTTVSEATAGTEGGISWKYRPDTMSVWIKRTGSNVTKEDFYLLYYAWSGTAKSSKYKGKNGNCTSVSKTNEESDIRQALDANECGTDTKANQIAEGMWREKKEYGNWTNIRVPIYYMNSDAPTMMNIIFSASNYPNFRANSGLYAGNSLYVDDVELIYSSKIQKLYIDDKEWKGFDPNSTEEQTYSLGRSATTMPKIEAYRGTGTLTNAAGNTANFTGRMLSSSEMTITQGTIDGTPTTITVKAEDGSSTTTYKIKFVREASNNAKLAQIYVDGASISNFTPSVYSYNVSLPYGTTKAPVITVDAAEDTQTIDITQPKSTTGTATIKVTAADKKTTATYTIQFSVAQLSDNTLKDILVNGKSLPGFISTQTIYRVSLPTGTTTMPTIKAVSAYPDGAQTIQYTAPTTIDGGTYQISVTTPGNKVAKVYKLNFKLEASTYSYLKDLQVEGGYIADFQADNFTYYVTLPMGTTQLPKITYEKGDDYQTVSISEGGLDGTTRVTVTAASGDQSVYKIVFTTLKSDVSTLKGIRIGGVELADFDPNKNEYTYDLPIGTTELPDIEPIKNDEYQTVNIIKGGINGTTRITVSAGDGSTTIYTITFSVKQASDATLKMIYLDGQPLENYNKDILEYTILLPQGTTKQPVVTYTPNDEYQTITVRSGSNVQDDYKITVRPQTGASRTYILHFSVTTSANTSLAMIYIDGTAISNFHADTLNYTYNLPEGVSTIPAVTFDKGESTQKVLSMCEGSVQTITVTAENGDKRTYTINFIIKKSENAFLKMIYIDGQPLTGFDKTTLNYTLPLTTTTCPAITVDKEPGQQVTIIAPYAAGKAQIRVAPESGAANIYTITFTAAAVKAVQLQAIYANGTILPDFDPAKTTYTLTYTDSLPTITYLADASQSVEKLRNGQTINLYVQSGDANTTYSITCSRQANNNATLNNILLDGTPLAGFSPTQLDYVIDLPAGSKPQDVAYIKNNDRQVVFFGQTQQNKVAITVLAETGLLSTYTVTFRIAEYADARLQDMSVSGYDINFDPEKTNYALTIDKGAALPQLSYTAREGQNIIVSEPNADQQQVMVTAQNGTTMTYTVNYTRRLSSNALLSDILINGTSLKGFQPTLFNYTDSLAWRTQVVPCIFPVGQLASQTITTYYSSVNGTTTITVLAADGTTANTYTIYFPVRKSNNNKLQDLYLNSEIAQITFAATTNDYTVMLPYQTKVSPTFTFLKDEDEQQIEYTLTPLRQANTITVTAENGDQRTYSILFQDSLATADNNLKTLSIAETGEVLNVKDSNYTVSLPYGTRTLTVNYTKAFDEQTVWVQPGGINAPTIITVKSNRPDELDHIYTITPQIPTQYPAFLNSITVDGTEVPNFDVNRLTYIVNRSNTSVPNVSYNAPAGVQCTPYCDMWHWTATVATGSYSRTYTVFFHYTNSVIPNGEFNEWTSTASSKSAKPTSWNAPGDYINTYAGTAKAGPTISKDGTSVVHLKTTYWAALLGPVPAVLNLGEMSASFAVAGGTRVTASGSIGFYNSPDNATINYKYTDKAGNGALFRFKFYDNNKTEYTFDHKETTTSSTFADKTIDLSTDQKNISSMDIIIDATGQYPSASSDANLYVDYIRFSYNSTLTGLSVNGTKAVLKGNVFTAILTDVEDTAIPQLDFTGQVSDQAQKITWQEPTTLGNYSIRQADIVNYAEDGTSTNYTLKVQRQLDTRTALKALYVDDNDIFSDGTNEYTIHLASSTRHLPSVNPLPISSLQTITTSYADSTYTILVTSERGDEQTYSVHFVTDISEDATLAGISGIASFDPNTFEYSVDKSAADNLIPSKQMDGQTVHVYTANDKKVFEVTAEAGNKNTYVVNLTSPITTTAGTIQELEINNNIYSEFEPNKYDYTLAQPTNATFTRTDQQDSVVFLQAPTMMQWQVYGSTNHTYTITYPTALSSNSQLANILINGVPYADFAPAVYNYTIRTNDFIHLEAVKAEEQQTITTAFDTATSTYTICVKAADQYLLSTYSVRTITEGSSNNNLSTILLDSIEIPNFNPSTLQYTVTLPATSPKISEPQLPSLSYIVDDDAQMVELSIGDLGENTYLTVTAQDGKTQEYSILIQSEPSHNADLTGIIVNGQPMAHFESSRHYYSARSNNEDNDIQWTSDDNFQTVELQSSDEGKILHVTAQDGTTTQDYTIELFIESLSKDATLSDILLNGVFFTDFERSLNPKLTFSPMQNSYSIHLPAGSTSLPEVSAAMQTDNQSVNITSNGMSIYLDVTAADGTTHNRYTLDFDIPLSSNANLSMIYINGDSLSNFKPDYYFYQVILPVGMHDLPEIAAQKAESTQEVTSIDVNSETNRATINVLAEDTTTTTSYVILFQFTQSDADTLTAIYADGLPIAKFNPSTFYYNLSLPVGTTTFPELSWHTADSYQIVRQDTVQSSATQLIRQLIVTSESGHRNYYTISYDILLSDVDTLQMIYINDKPLENFTPYTNEYWYTVSASTTDIPTIYPLAGDAYQTIDINYTTDSITTKSLNQKAEIEVTAGNNSRRTYTIHFPQELSSDATLNMILVGGQNISDYDSERLNYKLSLDAKATSIPVITVIKKEDTQVVEISMHQDTVLVEVTAEDLTTLTYTLIFERVQSSNANLQNITLSDGYALDFAPTHYDYAITLPYGTDSLPLITPIKAEEEQQVEIHTEYLEGTNERLVTITVTAANLFDQCAYTITFSTEKNNDASITEILLRNEPMVNFHTDSTEYTIQYPVGTDTTQLLTAEDVRAIANDSLATITITDENTTIMINVTAQNGDIRTYIIYQVILEDSENALKMIYLNDNEIADFDPNTDFYTYYVAEGSSTPKVSAEALSEYADVNIKEAPVGDTCIITCTAASGDSRKYYIWFAVSTINTSDTPNANDVLIKHIAGTSQVAFATLRKNVFVGVYTPRGELIFYAAVPESDQNNATIVVSAEGTEKLIDDSAPSVICTLPSSATPYIYIFSEGGKRRISSEKISISN